MLSPFKKAVFPFILICILVSSAHGQNRIVDHKYSKSNGSSITVTNIFGDGKKGGALPFLVAIRNGTETERTWNIQFMEGGNWRSLDHKTPVSITVPAGSQIETQVLVPIAPVFASSSGYRDLRFTATVTGFPKVERSTSSNASDNWPSLALSSALASRSLANLSKKKTSLKAGSEPFGHTFEPAMLPTDWRGYTSLDVLLIDFTSWKAITAAQKRAITEWVRLGGQCDIYPTEAAETEARVALKKWLNDDSLGRFQVWKWNGTELPDSIVKRYRTTKRHAEALENDFQRNWKLLTSFGTKKFNVILIFCLLFAFAIVVAPVNLFYFAGPGKRHRLFITTPIISLIAVGIMSAIIFLEDGFGGSGKRIAIADLQSSPDEMRLYLTQEQISRTGVIVNTGFTVEEPIQITPVNLPKSRWNALSKQSGSLGQYIFYGNNFEGDFFRSRNEQGFSLRTSRPTRARIEIRKPGGSESSPELFSSLDFSIREFLMVDESGKIHTSPEGLVIDPGNTIPLQITGNTSSRNPWQHDKSEGLSNTLKTRFRNLSSERGRFFALAARPGELLIPTHSSIRWKDDVVLITGTLPLSAQKEGETKP